MDGEFEELGFQNWAFRNLRSVKLGFLGFSVDGERQWRCSGGWTEVATEWWWLVLVANGAGWW